MLKDKKIKIQQDIIQKLEQEISQLKEENSYLQAQLNLPSEGYEKAKEMIMRLEQREKEYNKLIAEIKELQITYRNKVEEISDLKKEYKKALKAI